jgi:hypothetical protein
MRLTPACLLLVPTSADPNPDPYSLNKLNADCLQRFVRQLAPEVRAIDGVVWAVGMPIISKENVRSRRPTKNVEIKEEEEKEMEPVSASAAAVSVPSLIEKHKVAQAAAHAAAAVNQKEYQEKFVETHL